MTRIVAPFVLFCSLMVAGVASAVFVEERLPDPKQEERAREISEDIRCLVCQNQSIMDSNADLAKDLRGIVRERIVAGDSDDEVRQYLVTRYGDWVLLNPPFKARTLLLWGAPVVMILVGLVLVVVYFRRKVSDEVGKAQITPLSVEEEKQLQQILGDNKSEDKT